MAEITSYPTATPKGGDYLLGAQVGEPGDNPANPTKKFTVASISTLVSKGYTDYVFSFTQSGADNPVVTQLTNITGVVFTFTRSSQGVFLLEPTSDIPINKLWVQVTGGDTNLGSVLNIAGISPGPSGFPLIPVLNTNQISGIPQDEVEAGFIELRIYS